MGKVRTRVLGLEDVEEKQKKKQKEKLQEKKLEKKKVVAEAKKEVEKEIAPQEEEKKVEVKSEKAKKTRKSVSAKKRGKKYQKAKEAIDSNKSYTLGEALELLTKIKYAGFDESVELHANLSKEGMRGEISLPHSTGKDIRVAIVNDAVLEAIEKGKIDFDVLISQPSYMPKLARFAKILGPRGLMPSPKAGTIGDKPEEIAKKFKSGTVRWKGEAKAPLAHLLVGRISYDKKALSSNFQAYVKAIGKENITEIFIKTTMSPSVRIDLEKV